MKRIRTCSAIVLFTVNTEPKTKPIPLKRTLYIVDCVSCVAQLLHSLVASNVERRRWLMSFFVSEKKNKIQTRKTRMWVNAIDWCCFTVLTCMFTRTVLTMCDFSFLLSPRILFFFFSGLVIIPYELFGLFYFLKILYFVETKKNSICLTIWVLTF